MRLFIATFLDTRLISQNYNNFKSEASKFMQGKWVERDILHFTYHFMGSVNEEVIPELKEKLEPFLIHYDEKINVHSLKINPNITKPKLLVTQIFNPSKNIYTIRKDIQSVLNKMKIDFEKKKFKPHMTLLRIKSVGNGFARFIEDNADFNFGYLKGFDIKLVQSTLTNERPIYTIL